jgi:hypothetical protein
MIQSGYAALLLDSLLQFCPADSAVLETTASNHTNASSRMFQSTTTGHASNSVTSPALIGGGRLQRRLCGGGRQIPPQGPVAVQGRQRQRRQGLNGVGLGVVRGYGHGTTGVLGSEAVWVTNLQDKFLAAGRPPALDILRILS